MSLKILIYYIFIKKSCVPKIIIICKNNYSCQLFSKKCSLINAGTVLTMPWVLNVPVFWICQDWLHKVLNILEYAWIISDYAWMSKYMPGYTRVCLNIPKFTWMAFALNFFIVILCSIERVITYFKVCTKLEAIV